jgi:AraC-like DNA-binding protein
VFPNFRTTPQNTEKLMTRMISSNVKLQEGEASNRSECRGLAKWRLMLVKRYVERHLGEKVTLADMASAARLSRMHFATLFRRTTGIRPHEYLLKQRIQAAQQMLEMSDKSIVEIAGGVGFQTQAHFTNVFKRFAGHTPARWRALVQSRLLQDFENYDIDDASLHADALGSDGTLLVTGPHRFDIEVSPETRTTIALTAKILDDGHLRAARVFEKSVPMERQTTAKAAAALNRALSELARDLVEWSARAR